MPFENAPHSFVPGTRFEQIRGLYGLDRKLRLLIMEAIEIAARTAMAYRISHQYGPFAHAEVKNLKPTFNHAMWMADVLTETDRSKETFVSHFKAHCGFRPREIGEVGIMWPGPRPGNATVSNTFVAYEGVA